VVVQSKVHVSLRIVPWDDSAKVRAGMLRTMQIRLGAMEIYDGFSCVCPFAINQEIKVIKKLSSEGPSLSMIMLM
jgi:hypothetical protein